ncbi:MAG TPA: hypothetical protein VEO74_16615 [Thermoanaerobaculia bacterium]|nr:hypothetical protein [Thermoanaerobaculia bacterium]
MKRLAALALFVLVAIAAVGPIRSYDYFWQLAAGRWIVDHHALPASDPLAIASEKSEWIDGEWLWQAAAYIAHNAGGDNGMSIYHALFVGLIFGAAFLFSEHDVGVALALCAVGFAGASDRLGVRPATDAALFTVVAIGLLSSKLPVARLAVFYGVLTIVWINVHPSALLAPVLAAMAMFIDVRRWTVAAASAVALLVNPYGWKAITAPLKLSALIRSGEFVNAEWLPSPWEIFPLLYVTIAALVLFFAVTREKRANLWRMAMFVLLAALAVRYVRNQGLYFAALPLLVPPVRKLSRNVSIGFAVAALVPLGWAMQRTDHATGADPRYFPLRAVAKLKSYALPGNIYNVDQFGGLIEWELYPQRRALTDGRNELFAKFIAEDDKAHHDSRAWHAMIVQYDLALAVDEYAREKVEVVDAESGERRSLPASLVRYRRRDWALIAFDDVAMVFARRDKFPPEVIDRIEYRFLVPDDPHIRFLNEQFRNAARDEAARARRELGDLNVVRELEEGTKPN